MSAFAVRTYAAMAAFLAVALGCLFGYIAHLKRTASRLPGADSNIDGADAVRRYSALDVRFSGVALVLAIVGGTCAYLVQWGVAAGRAALLPEAVLSIRLEGPFLTIPALFQGLALACLGLCRCIMRLWPEDAWWYISYLSGPRGYGCDYRRLLRGMGVGTIVLTLVPLTLGLNCYAQVRGDGFAFHRFFAWKEEFHPFRDVRSIETAASFIAPNGRVRKERDYIVHFANGSKWGASDLLLGDRKDHQKVMLLLSEKSGVPIKDVGQFTTSDIYD